MSGCPGCGGEVGGSFRFCPWCAEPLRRKLIEFFRPHPLDAGNSLRVSRYVEEGHVRFSVWSAEGVAEAAVSLHDREAERLAAFVHRSRRRARRTRLSQLLHRV
jgi:hypothetical protein